MRTTLHRLRDWARIDRAVAYTLLNRVWMLGSNVCTMLLIVHFFSGEQQGLYFTFLTLLGLHAVFDLGVSFSLTQWSARTRAAIEDGPGTAVRVADGPAKERLALLAAQAARQACVLAALFFVSVLCLGAWLFGNDARVARSQWLWPWALVTLFTSLRLLLLAVEGLLEGLGEIGSVARVRLAGLVAGTLGLWSVVAGGGDLYGIAASCALAVCVPALAYGRRYGPLLADLARAARGASEEFSWRREVWPFQRKFAATLLTGFAVASLFNPAVYYYHGAEAAGRFGLGMSIAQAVAGFMSVWLNCKVPRISMLAAERRYRELQQLFHSTKGSAAAVALLAGAAALALVGLLELAAPRLGARIPPVATLLVLLAAAVLQQYVLTIAVFARAQAREPLLMPSLLTACVTPALLAMLVPRYGALGAALSYLLPVLLVSLPSAHALNRQIVAMLHGHEHAGPAVRLRRFLRSLRGLYALRHLRGHLALARVMEHPGLFGLVRRRPRVLFKYLHRNYLAAGLDSRCRLAILTHHYVHLSNCFPAPFLRTLLAEGLVIWRLGGGAAPVAITLALPRHDFEGELLLALQTRDVQVYTLTATLACGSALGAGAARALFITCLQGGAGQLALIRQATRACANTPPPHLLLAALGGLAQALQVERIVAVGNTRQLAKVAGEVQFDYDRFWTGLGGVPTHDGFFLFPPQLPERPLRTFVSRHRSREVRKRDLKRSVAATVAGRLRQGDAAPPSMC
ncbi:MAG: DUF535 family protein [Telluria sp.]